MKSLIAIPALAIAVLGGGQNDNAVKPVFQLKEESMTIEYTASSGEGVIIVQAESEEVLTGVVVRDPEGKPLLKTWSRSGAEFAFQGFVIESAESSELPLLEAFSEGAYTMQGISMEGETVVGSASLSHHLLDPPSITYPLPGDVNVPTNLTVNWVSDPSASGYRIVVEQGNEDDLTATLPAGSSSFQVPQGILAPATISHVEVGAIAPNGNCTLVEVQFVTD